MARIPLISGNWKMNLNHFEAIQLVQKLSYELSGHDFGQVEVALHPPYTDLRSIQTVIDADRMGFELGAQNCHTEASGAFTGEISPAISAGPEPRVKKTGTFRAVAASQKGRKDPSSQGAVLLM